METVKTLKFDIGTAGKDARTVDVAIYGLTVKDVRAWLIARENDSKMLPRERSDMEIMFDEMFDLSYGELMDMTDLSEASILLMTEAQINDVIAACKECNPGFFRLRARLMDLGAVVMSAASN